MSKNGEEKLLVFEPWLDLVYDWIYFDIIGK